MVKSPHHTTFSPPEKPVTAAVPASADCVNAEMQFHLGLKFAGSGGTVPDYAQAAEWYRKAAEQNHSLAQFNLGMMYAHGQGVRRDAAQSRAWYGKAAQQGDAGAQFHLGNSCHQASFSQTPEKAAESRIEAYKWFRLAAAQGYQGSEMAHTILSLDMTRADISAGNQRVAAFKIGKPKIESKAKASTEQGPAAD
ncbi:MAG: tetratricopeptide repeat protein [Verrucomicrobiia bacterium]